MAKTKLPENMGAKKQGRDGNYTSANAKAKPVRNAVGKPATKPSMRTSPAVTLRTPK